MFGAESDDEDEVSKHPRRGGPLFYHGELRRYLADISTQNMALQVSIEVMSDRLQMRLRHALKRRTRSRTTCTSATRRTGRNAIKRGKDKAVCECFYDGGWTTTS